MKKYEELGISRELYNYIRSQHFDVAKAYYPSEGFISVRDSCFEFNDRTVLFTALIPCSATVDEFISLFAEMKNQYCNGYKLGQQVIQNKLCKLLGVDDKIQEHYYEGHD